MTDTELLVETHLRRAFERAERRIRLANVAEAVAWIIVAMLTVAVMVL